MGIFDNKNLDNFDLNLNKDLTNGLSKKEIQKKYEEKNINPNAPKMANDGKEKQLTPAEIERQRKIKEDKKRKARNKKINDERIKITRTHANHAKQQGHINLPPNWDTDGKGSPSTNRMGASDAGLLQSRFAGSMATSGAMFNQEYNWDTSFNALHRMDYYDPYTGSGLHIFMTRPFLNLSSANIANSPRMMQAGLSKKGCILLAQLMYPGRYDEFDGDDPNYTNAALQFKNIEDYGIQDLGYTPFMPRISNTSTGLNGLKDLIMEKYEYDGDRAGNKTADAMGTQESESSGEVTIPYIEDSQGSIVNMHTFWMEYIDAVGYGTMLPTDQHREDLIYDYMTGIYFFATGPDGMSITWYGELVGVFPLNIPTSSMIPSERGQNVDPKVSINYHYNHIRQNNPITLNRFNKLIYTCLANSQNRGLVNPPDYNYLGYREPFKTGMLHTWLGNEFNATKNKDQSRGGAVGLKKTNLNSNGQQKYNKYMGPIPGSKNIYTNPNAGQDGKLFGKASNFIYTPTPQVTWHGHPYIINGKLVYMDLDGTAIKRMSMYSQSEHLAAGA